MTSKKTPSKRPSERFPWRDPGVTKAQLLEHVERLAKEKAKLERQVEELALKAYTNPTTGGMTEPPLLAAMQPIHGAAVRHVKQSEYDGSPMPSTAGYAVLALDLNNFKYVNDYQSYQTGDHVLGVALECLTKGRRGGDLVAHPHGDEFFVVLAEVNREGALDAARDIRKRIERAGRPFGVTASIALAYFDPLTMGSQMTPKGMYELARSGLLKEKGRDIAKNAHHNRVVYVPPVGEVVPVDKGEPAVPVGGPLPTVRQKPEPLALGLSMTRKGPRN